MLSISRVTVHELNVPVPVLLTEERTTAPVPGQEFVYDICGADAIQGTNAVKGCSNVNGPNLVKLRAQLLYDIWRK